MSCYSWHQAQVEQLSQGEFQSLLVTAAAGQGVEAFVKHLTERLMCQTQDGCGHCKHCRWLADGGHPDVMSLYPEGAANALKIDAIREVVEQGYTTTNQGGKRVIRLFQADRMNQAGANGLLKILEEPPAGTHFILSSTLPGHLPATILSRCRQVRLPSAPRDMRWLDQIAEDSPERQAALRLTQAPDRIIELLQDPKLLKSQENWRDVLIGGLKGNVDLVALPEAAKPLGLHGALDLWYQIGLEQAKANISDQASLKRFALFHERLQRERLVVLNQVTLNPGSTIRALGGLWLRVAPATTTN